MTRHSINPSRPAAERSSGLSRSPGLLSGALLCLALAATACGSDAKTTTTTTVPTTTATPTTVAPTTAAPTTTKPTTPTTPTTPKPTVPAAAPAFLTFHVTPAAVCESGNATFTMGWTTKNVVGLSIDIGSTGFKSTAGYGPNETAVVASVPCTGAGTSTIQMKGCDAAGQCAESEKVGVVINRPPNTPTTAAPAAPTTAATSGPSFLSFDVTPSAACQAGNASFTMAYTTRDVVGMSIDIGSTGFKSTAGYGPNETGVVASVPCTGAGSSTIQMKGCNAGGQCAESDKVAVTITA